MNIAVFRVSDRGQMALPAEARRRWDLSDGGASKWQISVMRCSSPRPAGAGCAQCFAKQSKRPADIPSWPAKWPQKTPISRKHASGRNHRRHPLLQILLDEEPPNFRSPGARILTTGLWYHRLSRAVSTFEVTGSMSRRLGRADPVVAAATTRAITTLPETIGLLSLRELAWPMAQLLQAGVPLNLMSLEALAATEGQGAELCLAAADENPQLLDAAASRGTPARVMDD
jgi:hypothetical protein